MTRYLLLQNPGHNRVYYSNAGKLALSELQIACDKISADCNKIEIVEIAKIRYLSFQTSDTLNEQDLSTISRLSFVFAIYSTSGDVRSNSLTPIEILNYEYIENKISTILKYPGKTNELFTKMMLNVGLLSSDFDYDKQVNMLDPVAGRGTSLFEAGVYGFNGYGIELEVKPVNDSTLFFKKFLEADRYKYKMNKRQVSGKNKHEADFITEFVFAKTKAEFAEENSQKKLGFINGNSAEAFKYFGKDYFHLIIGDLPYGIAHGNTAAKKQGSVTRNPIELLKFCLPEWKKTLKPGGTIVLAWNTNIISKHQISKVFVENELEVLSGFPYDEFEHQVDNSIKRDIIVVRKN